MIKQLNLKNSFWYDLNFHILSCMPIPIDDASSLYEKAYCLRMEEFCAEHSIPVLPIQEDARILAKLHKAAPAAHYLLYMLALFDSWREFLELLPTPFKDITWSSPRKVSIATILKQSVPDNLIEFYRIVLWKTATGGYKEVHKKCIAPLYQQQTAALADGWTKLTTVLRGIPNCEFMTSCPLRRYGRGLVTGDMVRIFTGLPSGEFSVPSWAPLMQGGHEYILTRITQKPQKSVTPKQGTPGFTEHMAREVVALALGANLYRNEYKQKFRLWLKHWFPHGSKGLASSLPWYTSPLPGETDSHTMVEWLAGGEAVPLFMRETYANLLNWFNEPCNDEKG